METWTDQWPTEPGTRWWFYGVRSSMGTGKPHMMSVQVWKSGNDRPIYVADGAFMYKEEGAKGIWHRAIIPPLPDELNCTG